MAATTSFLLRLNSHITGPFLYNSQGRVFLQRRSWFRDQPRTKPNRASIIKAEAGVQKEDIVIVGAGIAGLATAVSLRRLGIGSLVLEQAESLRTGGTSLTLFKNWWRLCKMVVKSEDGRELRSFKFKDEDQTQEVRAVERRILLETLANELPPEAVQFSSKLSKIESSENGETLWELTDGSRLLAKIVIGCDGIRSPIAKWMGFSEPKYTGHCAFRGLEFYPNGQPFAPRVNYIYGRGLRAVYATVSPTKVYWFICYNSPSTSPKITDPILLKKQAKEVVKNWPAELLNLIDLTPNETVSKTPLVDRWLWPAVSPLASAGKVVLVGDAWHPMTPNLGQGACCALEDAVILTRKLADAINLDLHPWKVLSGLMERKDGPVSFH
ncbi:hypothetical protein CRYUN_Cryun07bG0177200 [Craigia yunnanensis]